jgi:hypothetical protein
MKQFLDLTTNGGRSLLIDVDTIIALQEEANETTKIFCQGCPEAFTVASSLFHVYVKLSKLKVAELAEQETIEQKNVSANAN